MQDEGQGVQGWRAEAADSGEQMPPFVEVSACDARGCGLPGHRPAQYTEGLPVPRTWAQAGAGRTAIRTLCNRSL